MKDGQKETKNLRLSIRMLSYTMVFIAAGIGQSYAAGIGMKPNGDGPKVAIITGEIAPGDAKKLSTLLTNNRLYSVRLDSPGGDVVEAIRMGEIIKTLRLSTKVVAGGSCASACFFVWMSGSFRLASDSSHTATFGRIGLHRPFLRNPENSETSLAGQSNVMRGVTSYLEAKLVPRRLIDLMMARPSNAIYWLNRNDIEELGTTPPDLEELYISKCHDNRRFLDQRSDAVERGDSRLVDEIEAKIFRIDECRADLDVIARMEGRKKLEGGWSPASPFQTKK